MQVVHGLNPDAASEINAASALKPLRTLKG
jgi:hypothetical protein